MLRCLVEQSWRVLGCLALWLFLCGFRCGPFVQECLDQQDCQAGTRCESTRCVSVAKPVLGCQSDKDCKVSEVCRSRQCVSKPLWQCQSDKDCQVPKVCRLRQCVDEPSPCRSSKESCNNKDDDCDGKVDEDFPAKGQRCTVGRGSCLTTGNYICAATGLDVVCDATAKSPQVERCNAQDDDCDGSIDEDFPTKGQPCSLGQGACLAKGVYVCAPNAEDVICQASPGSPSLESCNDKDDDCDGRVDNINGKESALSRPCYVGDRSKVGVGRCREGTQECRAGQWQVCRGYRGPVAEQCNNQIDDDCDGQVDENCASVIRKRGEWCDDVKEVCDKGLYCHARRCHKLCDIRKGQTNNPDCPSQGWSCRDAQRGRFVCKKICFTQVTDYAHPDCPVGTYCLVKLGYCAVVAPPRYGNQKLGQQCGPTVTCDGKAGVACVSGKCEQVCNPRTKPTTCGAGQRCIGSDQSFLGGYCG